MKGKARPFYGKDAHILGETRNLFREKHNIVEKRCKMLKGKVQRCSATQPANFHASFFPFWAHGDRPGNGPKQLSKIGPTNYLKWIRNGSRTKITTHEDHCMDRNCDAEPLEALPDPKTPVFDPKMTKTDPKTPRPGSQDPEIPKKRKFLF